jgi:hypothetical protein
VSRYSNFTTGIIMEININNGKSGNTATAEILVDSFGNEE